jgi:hypothetical protein
MPKTQLLCKDFDMYANPVVNQLKHSNELKAKILLCILVEPLGCKDFETGALKASISISYCKKFLSSNSLTAK